jgi:hypothetical protein
MSFKDSTLILLDSLTWLFVGICIYLLLTIWKVYILWYLQPKVLNTQVSSDKPFENSFNHFTQVVSSQKNIYKNTWRYIFRYKKTEWHVIENESIKKRIGVLNGLTTFLKPYLIIAIIYSIIRFWIESKLYYQELSISLGAIQKDLYFIEQFPIVTFFKDNKTWILLLYGLICIFVPFLYNKEDKTKKIKKYLSSTLIYLSLVSNISFFAVGISHDLSSKEYELTKLQITITDLHNKIYTNAATAVLASEIDQYAKAEEEFYSSEFDRINDVSKNQITFTDSSATIIFLTSITNYIANLRDDYLFETISFPNDPAAPVAEIGNGNDPTPVLEGEPVEVEPPVAKENIPSTADNIHSYYKAKAEPSSIELRNNYIEQSEQWTLEEGNELLKETTEILETPQIKNCILKSDKLKKIVDVLFESALDISADQIFEKLKIAPQKALKKVLSLVVSENFKTCFVNKTMGLLNSLAVKGKNISVWFKSTCSIEQTFTKEEKEQIVSANNEYIASQKSNASFTAAANEKLAKENERFTKENEELKIKISQKLSSMEMGIPSSTNLLTALRNTYPGYSDQELEIILLQQKFSYNNDLSINTNIQNIIKEKAAFAQGEARTNLSHYLIPEQEQMAGEQYNQVLSKNYELVSNETSLASIFRTISPQMSLVAFRSNFPGICSCCGLPLTFPTCLCRL